MTLYGHIPGGPYFDDLQVGQVFDWAPSMTLTAGAAASHQSIIGDRLRLALDADLTMAVTGSTAALAHPALVCDVAIGQTTLVTQRVNRADTSLVAVGGDADTWLSTAQCFAGPPGEGREPR